jgi:hypothetical protein
MAKERPPLEEMTLRQLRKVASECAISRYSRMRKSQLLAAIQQVQRSKVSIIPSRTLEAQEAVEAAKFELGQEDRTGGSFADVDQGLADLPSGYGESRIVLMPRDPQWAYTYWDIPNEHKQELRQQGGQQLALRIYDVTDISLEYQSPHSIQEYPSDELAREWYLPIPVSDRDYVVDIGYRSADGRWLVLARSAPVHVPPVYPSDWIEDHFVTVNFEEDLRRKLYLNWCHLSRKRQLQRNSWNLQQQPNLRRDFWDDSGCRSSTSCWFFIRFYATSTRPRTGNQFLRLPLWCGYVGSSNSVWFNHVWCGYVGCWLLSGGNSNAAASILVNCRC